MTWVSDEVWRSLDPGAGRLSLLSVRRLNRGLGAAVVLSLIAAVAALSGTVVARVAWEPTGFAWAASPGLIAHEVVVRNHGWTTVRLVGAGRSGPGLELTSVQIGLPNSPGVRTDVFPLSVGHGESTRFVLVYRITDCAAVTADPWPVPVRVDRVWGQQTVFASLPTHPRHDAPGMYYSSGPDPYAVQWQRYLADLACYDPPPP